MADGQAMNDGLVNLAVHGDTEPVWVNLGVAPPPDVQIVDAVSAYPEPTDPRVIEALEDTRQLYEEFEEHMMCSWGEMRPRVIRRLNYLYGLSVVNYPLPHQRVEVVRDVVR